MSDFSELCPLFTTGVYNELYLGDMTLSIYDSATYNFLSNPGSPATCPSSFRFGRSVVVTECWVKRKTQATPLSHTICVYIGRRTGTGSAVQSLFGTITFSMSLSTFPNIVNAWQAMGPTSFTLHTADVLDISCALPDAMECEFIVQYREK